MTLHNMCICIYIYIEGFGALGGAPVWGLKACLGTFRIGVLEDMVFRVCGWGFKVWFRPVILCSLNSLGFRVPGSRL